MGRPPIPPDQRLVIVSMRLTAEQADLLWRNALRERQSLGAYVRGLLSRVFANTKSTIAA